MDRIIEMYQHQYEEDIEQAKADAIEEIPLIEMAKRIKEHCGLFPYNSCERNGTVCEFYTEESGCMVCDYIPSKWNIKEVTK